MSHLEMNLEEIHYLRNLLMKTECPEEYQAILFNIEDIQELISRG